MSGSVEIWDQVHKSRQWGTCPEPAVARWAMRRWGGRDKDAKGQVSLLEVGCGVGAQAFWLANNGFLVDAIDASETAIGRAEHLYGNILPHSLHFWPVDVEHLTARPADGFDGVIDVCCLQHVDRLNKAVEACAAVLKPGGALFSMFASANHSPIMAGTDLAGTTLHRLTALEVYDVFDARLFSEVHVEQSMHTDKGKCIAHWIVEAVK